METAFCEEGLGEAGTCLFLASPHPFLYPGKKKFLPGVLVMVGSLVLQNPVSLLHLFPFCLPSTSLQEAPFEHQAPDAAHLTQGIC